MKSISKRQSGLIVAIILIALILGTLVTQQVYRTYASNSYPQKTAAKTKPALATTTNPILFIHGIDRKGAADCNATWSDALNLFSTGQSVNGLPVQWSGPEVTLGYYKGDINCTGTIKTFQLDCKGYYDTIVGTNNESIRHLGCELAWFIYTNYTTASTPQSVELAGYGMGGLIARWALTQSHANNPPFPPAKLLVRDAVELDSPNAGFTLSNRQACGTASHLCVEGQEMAPGSSFISDLAKFAQDPQGADGTEWTTMGSNCKLVCSSHTFSCLDITAQSAVNMVGAFKIVYQMPCYDQQGLPSPYTSTMLIDSSTNLDASVLYCNGCYAYPAQTGAGYPHALLAILYALVEAWTSPLPGSWQAAGNLSVPRFSPRATLLNNGMVLLEGGNAPGQYTTDSELFNPAAGTWTQTGSLNQGRTENSATLLPDGEVLIAGGYAGPVLNSAELYNPATGVWTLTGSMQFVRTRHTATLLPNGKVLVAGGWDGDMISSAELYDPATGTWSSAGNMAITRADQVAVLLPDGKVLVAGGAPANNVITGESELYDPATNKWTVTGRMNIGRIAATAVLLPDGKVLVAGGDTSSGATATAEIYDPATGVWTLTGSMNHARNALRDENAVLLADGTVLIAGGDSPSTSEVYNPAQGQWINLVNIGQNHCAGATAPLANGDVLIAGGWDCSSLDNKLTTTAIYTPAQL